MFFLRSFFESQKLFPFSEFSLSEFFRHVYVDFQGFVKIMPIASRQKKTYAKYPLQCFSMLEWCAGTDGFNLLPLVFAFSTVFRQRFFFSVQTRYSVRCKLVDFYCASIIFYIIFQIVCAS